MINPLITNFTGNTYERVSMGVTILTIDNQTYDTVRGTLHKLVNVIAADF